MVRSDEASSVFARPSFGQNAGVRELTLINSRAPTFIIKWQGIFQKRRVIEFSSVFVHSLLLVTSIFWATV